MTFPFYLPKESGQTRFFYAAGTIWQPYSVPAGVTMLHMVAVGSGGQGGAGHSAAAASARGGGGGGGSGAITRISIPASFLPQTIWVLVGNPVSGNSYVAVQPNNTVANTIIMANPGGNGGNGTGAAVGAAGSGGAATALASRGPYASLGLYETIAGQAGVAGGAIAGAVGTALVYGAAGIFVSGGASGAGTTSADFAGGAITGSGLVPTIPGGLAGSNAGNPGFQLWLPPTFTGGSGGGSSNTGNGGAGGIPGPGCGGGGGGGGVAGGAGAAGGPGFVAITHVF